MEALFWQAEEARGLNKNKDWSQSEAKQWKRIHKDGWNKTKSQKKDVHSRAVLITDAYLQLCLHAGTTHGFGGKKNRKRQHTSDNERWGFKTGMCHKLQGGVFIKYAKRYECRADKLAWGQSKIMVESQPTWAYRLISTMCSEATHTQGHRYLPAAEIKLALWL